MSPFLSIQTSYWPLLCSLILFSLLGNVVLWVNLKITLSYLLCSVLLLVFLIFLWWSDLKIERLLGYHTHKLEVRLRIGMLLFILSEVFFFLSFFWSFYDFSLAPSLDIGLAWPPKGVVPLSTYSVPLLNTIILLSRGLTVTWAHHSLINNFIGISLFSLFITVCLGVYFLLIQWLEYSEAIFRIRDGAFGSIFFMGTGFHGMHVIIGTLFLFYTFLSLNRGIFLYNRHFSFEAAAWYWHFVDVVWLFLFINIYWWGGLSSLTLV